MTTSFKILIHKLNTFIKRYYFHLLMKGGLLFLIIAGLLFLFYVALESFGYFNSATRAVLFFSYILINLIVFYYYIFKPSLGLMRLGKHLSHEEAAILLGKHFKNEVNDKIINTLQLNRDLKSNDLEEALLIASIEQKSSQLAPFPFFKAINFKDNIKYIPYAFVILIIFLVGWIALPDTFQEPAKRIVNYGTHFERPAPFSIQFKNDLPLTGVKNETFFLDIAVEGESLPENLDIIIGSTTNRMARKNRTGFNYEFRTLNRPVDFKIKAGSFIFGPYSIGLESKPVIQTFTVKADFPSYTRIPDEVFLNVGDVRVPEGTRLHWEIFTEDTDKVYFLSNGDVEDINIEAGNRFSHSLRAMDNLDYAIIPDNEGTVYGDTLSFRILVVKDQFPGISIEEFQDSLMLSHLFFRGIITDDYGFSGLSFHHRMYNTRRGGNQSDVGSYTLRDLPFDAFNLNQQFYYHFDLSKIGIAPGMTVEYFFQVTDNDQINGPKSTRSRIYTLSIPTEQELLAETLASDETVTSGLSDNIEDINNIQDEIDRLRRSMLDTDNVTWEQQEALKNLLEKQREAQEKFEQLKEFSENRSVRDQQFRKQDENILKKQEELQRLFEDVLSDELKDLYQQIQDELEKLDRDNLFDMLNQLDFEMQDLENRLDRALELFRQLQVERMLSESLQKLDRLQDELADLNESLDEEGVTDDSLDDQQMINEDFSDLMDLLKDMMEKNEELSRPNSLDDTSDEQNAIMQDLMDALEQMMNNDAGGAGEKQDGAAAKMENLSNALQQMQANMQQENLAEDIRTLREILDNLIKTSFAQERLMDEVRAINTRDPRYVSLIQEQRKISSDLIMIKDSLNALAKRQVQIQSIVSREISMINRNITESIEHLINRRKHTGMARQQFVMTHVNNLALLLNESMQNMQMQMQMSGQGEGQPQPSPGSPGFQDLRQMQEQMNQMLEQLRQGHQPMPGESGESQMGMSEQLARMAAEQEAIRNRLNELTRDLRRDGENTTELEQLMREMERTELDIVTDNITRQTQLRQQRILTRLLEHEKAQLEREQEERRVGETAIFYDLSNPADFFEYNIRKNRAMDMLRSLPPGFRPHYRSLVEIYFLNVQE